MSEANKIKLNIVQQLKHLCAHCALKSPRPHKCPVKEISLRIESLRGVPLVVNSEFKGMLWA